MNTPALADPLSALRAGSQLLEASREMGLQISISYDFSALKEVRQRLRHGEVSPMFDSEVSQLDRGRAFWVAAYKSDRQPAAIQAFRLDVVQPNLAEWALSWMTGLYLKRRELVLPQRSGAPLHTHASSLSGNLVYHGELWIDRLFRDRRCLEIFTRTGMLLAYLKWLPNGIWSLVGESMATRGAMVRMGYRQLERGFFSWEWEPTGAEPLEWLGIATASQLELLISEHAAMEELCPHPQAP